MESIFILIMNLQNGGAEQKVNRQNEKYGNNDTAIVIKGVIEGDTVWNLG